MIFPPTELTSGTIYIKLRIFIVAPFILNISPIIQAISPNFITT